MTPSTRPQRHRELPARLRDPDQIVEMPGQPTPPELQEAINLIKNETLDGWTIASVKKAINKRLDAVSAIKNKRELIRLITQYRKYSEPEPKWSTQQWINFILHGDPEHSTPLWDYRQVAIFTGPPANQPAQPAQPAQDEADQPAAAADVDANGPQPNVPGPAQAVQGPAPLPADDPQPGPSGLQSPTRTDSNSSHSSAHTVSMSSGTLTANESFHSASASPERQTSDPQPVPPGPSRVSPDGTRPSGTQPAFDPDELRARLAGKPSVAKKLVDKTVNVGAGIQHFTRQKMWDLGLTTKLPDNIVSQYPSERRKKK